jgi:hypothetical protein
MAFKLDNDLLEELGLAALSPNEKQAMLRQILETLEMRVGTTLASKMSDAQLDEFEHLMPAEGDDQTVIQQKEQQALQWLESNFPNYKQVVNEELEKLKSEIRQTAPQIVATSQQNSLPNNYAPQSPNPSFGSNPSSVPQNGVSSQPPAGPVNGFASQPQVDVPNSANQATQGFQTPIQQPPAGFTPPSVGQSPPYTPAPGFQPPIQQPPAGFTPPPINPDPSASSNSPFDEPSQS